MIAWSLFPHPVHSPPNTAFATDRVRSAVPGQMALPSDAPVPDPNRGVATDAVHGGVRRGVRPAQCTSPLDDSPGAVTQPSLQRPRAQRERSVDAAGQVPELRSL